MNQPGFFCVASFVAHCSLDFSSVCLVWLQAFFQASAQMPTRGIYSDVTLLTYLHYLKSGIAHNEKLLTMGLGHFQFKGKTCLTPQHAFLSLQAGQKNR
jgi:hypothetical protein